MADVIVAPSIASRTIVTMWLKVSNFACSGPYSDKVFDKGKCSCRYDYSSSQPAQKRFQYRDVASALSQGLYWN